MPECASETFTAITGEASYTKPVAQDGTVAVAIGEVTNEGNVYTAEITLTNNGDAAQDATLSFTSDPAGADVQFSKTTVNVPVVADGVSDINTATVTMTVTADKKYSITVIATDAENKTRSVSKDFGTDPTPDPDPNPGDNGSSNSGSSSSGSSSSTPANAPSANVGAGGAVSAAKISGDAKKAVSNAKNGKANVNVTNAKTVGTAALNNMAKAAAKEDVALTMTAKTTDKNGVVVASLKFDATKAAEAVAKAGTKEVKLGVELNTRTPKNVTSLFQKNWFKQEHKSLVKWRRKVNFGFHSRSEQYKVDLKDFTKQPEILQLQCGN